MKPRFPYITVDSETKNGNVLWILGRTNAALRAAGISEQIITDYMKDARRSTYAHLLATTRKLVHVI